MKLYYFKDPKGNFGDDLNEWLWGKLLADFFDEDESTLFVGIGTLINDRLPKESIKHVFGSGVGYGKLPMVDDKFSIHALRGYLSAQALGQPDSIVITDAAILVRAVLASSIPEKIYKFGFMPTGEALRNYNWEEICDELGYCFISPHSSVEDVIKKILSCEVLISEAMHGAIVADAIRVPWIPVDCYGGVLKFKWEDWLSTANLPYRPIRLPSLFREFSTDGYVDKFKISLKRNLKKMGVWSSAWASPLPKPTSIREKELALSAMFDMGKVEPFLSSDVIVSRLTGRYLDLLDDFKNKK